MYCVDERGTGGPGNKDKLIVLDYPVFLDPRSPFRKPSTYIVRTSNVGEVGVSLSLSLFRETARVVPTSKLRYSAYLAKPPIQEFREKKTSRR